MNYRLKRIAAVIVCAFLMALAPSVRAQAGGTSPNASQTQKRMAQAVESTLQKGLQAKLPPHISTLLGLTDEAECPVMQAVVRSGSQVRGFDVSKASKNDVVIFVVDETANGQVLFLTSQTGALRKVVKVEAGEGRAVKITAENRKVFEQEKLFWLDRLAPASKP